MYCRVLSTVKRFSNGKCLLPDVFVLSSANFIVSVHLPVLSPAVRALVDKNQLDPSKITPTGPGGRILKGLVSNSLLPLIFWRNITVMSLAF